MNYKQRGAVLSLQKRKTSLTAARRGGGHSASPNPNTASFIPCFRQRKQQQKPTRLKARLALSSHTYMGNSCTQMIPSYIAAWD